MSVIKFSSDKLETPIVLMLKNKKREDI